MNDAGERHEPFEELIVDAGRARAIVRRAHAESLCEGHFPGDPIVPGAYLAGLMADVAVHLMPTPRLARIEDCVFVQPVVPHAAIAIEARLADGASDRGRIDVEVWSRGACAARGRLRFGEPA
ncbi:MAG TPA: hypothetical protein VFD92_25360 [Candidatus Binatia bacterium]|nr:hypothetical protein [Candidatus Binatia bacterium]